MMNAIIRNVKDLDSADRLALEHLLGQPLEERHQVIINVISEDATSVPTATTDAEVPAWWRIYEGLEPVEADRLDEAIRQRTHQTRNFE